MKITLYRAASLAGHAVEFTARRSTGHIDDGVAFDLLDADGKRTSSLHLSWDDFRDAYRLALAARMKARVSAILEELGIEDDEVHRG